MTARLVARGLGLYVAFVVLGCIAAFRAASLAPPASPAMVVSVWQKGMLVARVVEDGHATAGTARVDHAATLPGAARVEERVTGTSRIATSPELLFSLSFVGGKDGLVATLDGHTAYVTPDDLLAARAYDHGKDLPFGLAIGVDAPVLWGLVADRLRTTVPDLVEHATLQRARFERSGPEGPGQGVTAQTLTPAIARDAMIDAAKYLARACTEEGRFHYLIDARSGKRLAGYDWPRHAGTTYFLAQAAAASGEPSVRAAAVRAAHYLTSHGLTTCGSVPCVGSGGTADLGSSALGALALSEVARTGLDPGAADVVRGLVAFLRQMQRADGEFMHVFDRTAGRPVDVQFLYYSGEAAFALARANRITHDPADLDAARRALVHLVGPAWRFFGDRYYYGEEHWTCQAMADLWDRAPDEAALDFCVRWQAYGRRMQYGPGDSPFDADGGFGVGPVVTPRLTPVASRSEAAAATLEVLRHAGRHADARAIDDELRRALALLVRRQLRPGRAELFADPAAIYGAVPSSEVDFDLRIDYSQHAGSALARWVALAP